MNLLFKNTPQRLVHPLTGEVLIENHKVLEEKASAIFSQKRPLSPIIRNKEIADMWKEWKTDINTEKGRWNGVLDCLCEFSNHFELEIPFLEIEIQEPTGAIYYFENYPKKG